MKYGILILMAMFQLAVFAQTDSIPQLSKEEAKLLKLEEKVQKNKLKLAQLMAPKESADSLIAAGEKMIDDAAVLGKENDDAIKELEKNYAAEAKTYKKKLKSKDKDEAKEASKELKEKEKEMIASRKELEKKVKEAIKMLDKGKKNLEKGEEKNKVLKDKIKEVEKALELSESELSDFKSESKDS